MIDKTRLSDNCRTCYRPFLARYISVDACPLGYLGLYSTVVRPSSGRSRTVAEPGTRRPHGIDFWGVLPYTRGMTEQEFRNEMWRHLVAILKAVALYWFGRKLNI